jgi:hypothetical protein
MGCPSEHGWELVNELFMPARTKCSVASSAILKLTKCMVSGKAALTISTVVDNIN